MPELAAIRSAFDRGGELSAAAELCRPFPGARDDEAGAGMRLGPSRVGNRYLPTCGLSGCARTGRPCPGALPEYRRTM